MFIIVSVWLVCQVWLEVIIVSVWLVCQVWLEVKVQVNVSHVSSLHSNNALTLILVSLKATFCVIPVYRDKVTFTKKRGR